VDNPEANPKPHLQHLVQVGVVVRNLDETIEQLSATFGFGPWYRFVWPQHREQLKGYYRGQTGKFSMALAFAKLGHVELELMQPLEGESVYSEFLATKGEGLHHIHFDVPVVADAVAAWKADGIEVIQSGTGLRPGTEWAYLNTAELPGFGGIVVELATKLYEGDEPPARDR
jgi:methylmalonyl-CoA/ethylmalonyl-CoA epimerase